MAEVQVTWLGDEDPSQQVITQYGQRFVKGEPVKVDNNDPAMAKFRHMSVFKIGPGKVELVASTEPEPVDPETGTEKDALRRTLDRLHVQYDGRANVETLRNKLAAAEAKAAGHE